LSSIVSVLPTTPLSSLFTPKIPAQGVFLSEDEGKLGESSKAGKERAVPLKRVELRIGGMTVRLISLTRGRILTVLSAEVSFNNRESVQSRSPYSRSGES
jgi:hypothetical protein